MFVKVFQFVVVWLERGCNCCSLLFTALGVSKQLYLGKLHESESTANQLTTTHLEKSLGCRTLILVQWFTHPFESELYFELMVHQKYIKPLKSSSGSNSGERNVEIQSFEHPVWIPNGTHRERYRKHPNYGVCEHIFQFSIFFFTIG